MNTTINSKKNLEEENKKKEAARWTPEQESLLALGGWLYYDSQKKLEKNFKNLEYDYLDKKFNIRTINDFCNFSF